jgi:hypothetical protein
LGEQDAIERDLAATHRRIAENIAELRDRLSPVTLAENAVSAAGEAVATLPSRPLGRGLIAAGLAIAGLWGLLALRRSSHAPNREHDVTT